MDEDVVPADPETLAALQIRGQAVEHRGMALHQAPPSCCLDLIHRHRIRETSCVAQLLLLSSSKTLLLATTEERKVGNMTGHAIMIRVTPEDFEQWLEAHNSCRGFRSDYGMSDGPVYRDAADPNVALVHLDTEDVGRA